MTNELDPTRSRDAARLKSRQRRVALRNLPSTKTIVAKINAASAPPIDEDDRLDAPPQHLAYGVVRVETKATYAQIVGQRLFAAYTIARGEIDSVIAYEIDEGVIFPSQVQPDGDVDLGVFSGKARLILQKGASGQEALTTFYSTGDLGPDARGTDIAWIAGRFSFDPDAFLGGTPKVSVVIKGTKINDPRTSTFAWHHNPALVIYDYLTRSRLRIGVGLNPLTIDIESVKDAADICDQIVAVKQISAKATPTASTLSSIVLSEGILPFQTGDRVTLSTGGGESLPSGLATSTDYYAIVVHDRTTDASLAEVKLASSYVNAIAGTAIANGNLSTDFTITKTGEPRYTISAQFEDREDKSPIIREMLKCMAGRLGQRDGLLTVTAGAATSSVLSIDLDTINTGIEVRPKLDPQDRSNAIIGTFRSPLNLYRATDYPCVFSVSAQTADGETILGRYDLPFVPRSGQAQRLASIHLGQLRKELKASLSGDLRLYAARSGERVEVTVPGLGWSARPFFINNRTMALSGVGSSRGFTVDLDLEATDDDVFTFDPETGEVLALPPILSNVPDPRVVLSPGSPQFSESLFVTTDGAGVRNRLTIVWEASNDEFVRSYRLTYNVVGDAREVEFNELRDTQLIIDDLAPGTYQVKIYARNSFNVLSVPSVGTIQVRGLIDVPEALVNFSGQIVGVTVFLQWFRSADLDVRVGGQIEIRHHPDESLGMSAQSLRVGLLGGERTSDQVPFKRGTYYVRAIDQGGRAGPFSAWSTEGVAPVQRISLLAGGAFTGVDGVIDEATIDEGAALFPSTNPENSGVVVNVSDELELDVVGGLVVTSGVYFFSTGITFVSDVKVVVEGLLRATIVDLNDVFDDRDGPVDAYPTWDSLATIGKADAELQMRTRRSGGSFGEWQRLDTKIVFANEMEFRIVLDSQNGAAQIRINQAKVFIQEAEFQRISQAGIIFAQHQGRMPLLVGNAFVSAVQVVHAGAMPLLEGAASVSDVIAGDLNADAINNSIVFCHGSQPAGSDLLGDDLVEDNEGTATGATLDAPHPAIGWLGINKSASADRVSWVADGMKALINTSAYSWAGLITVDSHDTFAVFFAAPFDDDSHTSPFFNFLIARDTSDKDLKHNYVEPDTTVTSATTDDNQILEDDNLPHWLAMVRDGDDFLFYLDGVLMETETLGSAPDLDWNTSAGIGNTVVIGARNDVDVGTPEGWVGLSHVQAVWDRTLTPAEILSLVDDPLAMFGSADTEPMRPVIGAVDDAGKRLVTPLATTDVTVSHTHAASSVMYVFAFVVSDQGTADTPTVTAKWEISSVESGTVEDITPNTDDDLDTESGLATLRVFRITGATTGAGIITVDVSFGGSGKTKTMGAVVVDVTNDGDLGVTISERDDNPASNPSSSAFDLLVQTPLSLTLRYAAIRGTTSARTITSTELFQRTPHDEVVGDGLSFETRHVLDAMSRPIGGHVPMDFSFDQGGADHAALAIEILPVNWDKPTVKSFSTGTATQASGQTDQVVINHTHGATANRALLVLVSTTNDSGTATTPTVTAKWEISAVESGTVTDLSIAAVEDTESGVAAIKAFLIKGATAGDGQVTVDVDMGSGQITRAVAVTVLEMEGVGTGGATASARVTPPSAVAEQSFSITPQDSDGKIIVLAAVQEDGHTFNNAGLAIDGPPLPTIDTGVASNDHSHSVTLRNAFTTTSTPLRTRWTNANEAASFAIEIKPA